MKLKYFITIVIILVILPASINVYAKENLMVFCDAAFKQF